MSDCKLTVTLENKTGRSPLTLSVTRVVIAGWTGRDPVARDKHIAELEAFFAMAPDARIELHPVKVAEGPWTAVVGVMEGTSAKTSKPFTITMASFGHWTNAGVMDEEFLFWDNAALNRQMGLGK